MRFHNSTNHSIFLSVHSGEIILKPQEQVKIDLLETAVVTLKHSYGSSVMSEKEIASDHMDDSLVSLMISSHKRPYFDIVLDCTYEITGEEDTQIFIEKETIRPIYTCSYDRLYPVVEKGSIRELLYSFPEKRGYEEHYLRAISNVNRKVILILLIILLIACLPMTLLCFLINPIVGIGAVLLSALLLVVIRFVGMWISKLICKKDCALVTLDFESDRIKNHFKK